MSFKYEISKFPTSGVNKLIATQGGAHIYNVTLTTDAWNGAIIKRGDWLDFDNYAEATATTFAGKVVGKAANGNFYVEVTADGNLNYLLVYNPPVVEADWNNNFKAEANFYLAAGEVARAHELKMGDIFELSKDGFDGVDDSTADSDIIGKTITKVSGKKPVIE